MIEQLGVIIPVYGDIHPALPLVESLVGDGVAEDDRPARVVLVDDCSPQPVDGSLLPAGVELIVRPTNGGFGAAVNTGLRALAAADDDHPAVPLALVLNSDLLIPEGFCREAVERSVGWQPAVVGFRQVDENGASGWGARTFPTISQQVVEWLVPLASQRHREILHRAVGHDVAAEKASGAVPVDWVSGAAMLLPIAEVLEIGAFDEGYFMYTEEVDLQLRLRERGVPSIYLSDLEVVHEGGGSSGGEARRRQWLVGARMRYARKHLNQPLLRAGMTAATGVNLLWNSGRCLAGRDVQPLEVAREEMSLIWKAGKDLPR